MFVIDWNILLNTTVNFGNNLFLSFLYSAFNFTDKTMFVDSIADTGKVIFVYKPLDMISDPKM